MEKVYAYYRFVVAENEEKIRKLNRRMNLMAAVRLILVAGWVATLLLFGDPGITEGLWITAIYAVPFSALMVFHDRLLNRKKYAETGAESARNELKAADYDYSAFDGSPEKTDTDHSFSFDLDLFGETSLFQSLNRSVTCGGKEKLAGWFLHPLQNKTAILKRQEAIQELSGLNAVRLHFFITGKLHQSENDNAGLSDALSACSLPFARKKIWKLLVWLVPALWGLVAVGYLTGLTGAGTASLYFLICIFPAYGKTKRINALHRSVDKTEKVLSGYANLIRIIEENEFKSGFLQDIRQRTASGNGREIPASQIVRQLSRLLNALDQRSNLFAIILNIFILRDIRTAIRLERWKQRHQAAIGRWFDALADFDALNSLGTFAFNHPEYTYPAISEDYFVLEGKGLGHPLMRREACVKNDVSFRSHPSFMIVTGANMAGKSTYLRTVAVNYLLACTGAPVCAEEMTVYPAGLVTSLRTSDSLTRNESYFFAELKRLKMIIDRLKNGEQLFIVLDEILKGTNSADKQKGSIALVRQLVSCGACGIIATHDLVLGTLAEEFPESVRNYRFEGEITENALSFSYRLQEGIAQNMNATFLMEKMGITLREPLCAPSPGQE